MPVYTERPLAELFESMRSEDPYTFSAALIEVLVAAAADRQIAFRHAAYVDWHAERERHYDALLALVFCLAFRHDWPPPDEA